MSEILTNWKYINKARQVVVRTWDDGRQDCVLVTAEEIAAYLRDGNAIGPATQAELDAETATTTTVTQLVTDIAAVKNIATVVAFLRMTPAQIDAYVDANVTGLNAASLNSIKDILKLLGKVVAVVARAQIAQ